MLIDVLKDKKRDVVIMSMDRDRPNVDSRCRINPQNANTFLVQALVNVLQPWNVALRNGAFRVEERANDRLGIARLQLSERVKPRVNALESRLGPGRCRILGQRVNGESS